MKKLLFPRPSFFFVAVPLIALAVLTILPVPDCFPCDDDKVRREKKIYEFITKP